MIEQKEIFLAIAVIASIVYLTRAGGYFIGLQIRHIGGLRPVLEALPGCAFMAILAPAVRQGSTTEIVAMICVVGLMWKTDNVVLATVIGMIVLIFGENIVSAAGI